jgi:hypothetical protein
MLPTKQHLTYCYMHLMPFRTPAVPTAKTSQAIAVIVIFLIEELINDPAL